MKNRLLSVGILMLAAGAWSQAADTAKPAAPAEPAAVSPVSDQGALQEEVGTLKGQLDGLNETFLETKATVDKLSKIKLSGYVQPQWQHADSAGIASIAGGSFPAGTNQRFQVRRGRLKTTYETTTNSALTSRYVLQIDVIPTGVTLKDAYVTLIDPWIKTASLTLGVFDRPFGFEIAYSSSSRESPERSRVFQTLFPGERDMGAKLELTPPMELGALQYFNLKGGVFTGMGPVTNEIDKEQDFIGRAGFQAPLYDLNLAIDGGFSAYLGKSVAANDSVFEMASGGVPRYLATTGRRASIHDRTVMGVDAQVYYDLPVLGGLSLRGEYLWGEIPGTRGASGPYAAATTALVNREVAGWYALYVQNLGSKVQSVIKYDIYDPNTAVEGSDVGAAGSNLNAADLATGTLGLGLLFHWDENVRLMAYYDQVTNEEAAPAATGSLAAWKQDLSDNVFTFRVQMKF